MKSINKNIIPFLLMFFIINGCNKDLLNKTPLDQLSPSSFYQNTAQAKMALVGIYNSVKPRSWNDVPNNFYQYEFMSDNGYCQAAWQGSNEIGSWSTNSNSWAPASKWEHDYITISRANKFIQDIGKATAISSRDATPMIAEAKFLRAFAYSDLISFFGDVPLITVPFASADTAVTHVKRTAKASVLTQIIADFTDATSVLPISYTGTDVGRVTKGAALAYKAKILLYNQKWTDAAQAASDVINMSTYSLYPNYADLFTETHENNQEVIFDIQYIPTTNNQSWPSEAFVLGTWQTSNVTADLINSYYMTNGQPITSPTSGYNDQKPYVNRDPRLDATVVLPGTTYGSATWLPASYAEYPCGAKPRKYAEDGIADVNNSSLNTILMRYADVLLMRAEALIESGSTSTEIYSLIDQVRARVGMPTVESVEGTGLSQTQLRAILRHERRVEFAGEGTRYTDMLRWQDQSLVHDVYGYDKTQLVSPTTTWIFSQIKIDTRKFDAAKAWLWPIPQEDIIINKNLLPQNPGY
jgi:hypothetical protein